MKKIPDDWYDKVPKNRLKRRRTLFKNMLLLERQGGILPIIPNMGIRKYKNSAKAIRTRQVM